jgi:hypothetical protein
MPLPLPRRSATLLALAVLAVLPQLRAQAALPEDRQAGAASVDVAQCRQWLGTLAGPEFAGRGTGQPGFELAANYVAAHFKALGLEARGENGSYFQHVPWTNSVVDPKQSSLRFHQEGREVLVVPVERLTGTCSSSFAASGDVVLVRPKLVTVEPEAKPGEPRRRRPSLTVQGLDGAELQGKVVLVQMPPASGDRMQAAMGRFAVLGELQGKSCAAILFLQRDPVQGGLRGRGGMARAGRNPAAAGAGRAPLNATLGGEDAVVLCQAANTTPEVHDGPAVLPLGLAAEVKVHVDDVPAPAMNVFAVLPGSDPKLRDEYVVVGSHLDHLGRSGEVVSPGADDDASGTTGVMAVAQMLARNPVRPARSTLFVCFSGEENGLVGSGYFAKNCPIPLASIVAELQMDMIGRDEEENAEGNRGELAEQNRNSLHLIGTEQLAPALHELCLAKNTAAKFDLEWDQEEMFGRSDHANFAKYGVPIAFFFTGLHRDYHQPTDTAEKIHYEKLLRVATYVYDIAFELAIRSDRPAVAPELWAKYRGKASKEPAAPLVAPAGDGK